MSGSHRLILSETSERVIAESGLEGWAFVTVDEWDESRTRTSDSLRYRMGSGRGADAAAPDPPVVRYENEVRAYQQEINYAGSIGDEESVTRLNQLIREEYAKIFGEEP